MFLKYVHEIDIYSFDAQKHQHYLYTWWVEKRQNAKTEANEEDEGETLAVTAIPTRPNFPSAQQYHYSANNCPSHGDNKMEVSIPFPLF